MKQGISPNNHISGAASSELKGEGAIEKEVEFLPESEGIEDRKGEAEEEVEESRQPKIARVPVKPTKAEWDAHMLLHAEYRSWCPYCVRGKAHSNQHALNKKEEEKIGVTISMDYTYMGSEDDENDENGVAHLVMHDNGTSALWCMKVDSKEAKPEIVAWMNQNLIDAGYVGVKLTLKSDGEPAMRALKRALAIKRECETAIIHTPARESKSNGAVERAIQTWKGQMRTMRLHLEDRLKSKIGVDHPVLSWLAVWACDVMSRYRVRDGRTAYELMTGHRVKNAVYAFGQRIWGMFSADKTVKNDHDSKWFEGYFVGIMANCGSYLVMTADTVYKVATTRAMGEDVSFSIGILDNTIIDHQSYCRNGASSKRKAPVTVEESVPDAVHDVTARFRIPR